MIGYIARRLVHAVVVLWLVFTLTFFALNVLPSDAAELRVGTGGTIASVEALREKFGLDQPILVQYFRALSGVVRGDFGLSYTTGQPVVDAIGIALVPTLSMTALALAISLVVGVALALAIATTRSRWVRRILEGIPPLGVAVPEFWIGLVLVQIVAFNLGWLPATGTSGLEALILPAITLSVPTAGIIAQLLSASLLATLAQPYVKTATTKGASPTRVLLVHALKNSIMPTLTMLGIMVGHLIAGSVVVETVFARSGIGRLVKTSVTQQDMPVVLGLVVTVASAFVLINLLVDLAHPLIDARVRVTGARSSA
jgi:peptide/nickel transport system permease protein